LDVPIAEAVGAGACFLASAYFSFAKASLVLLGRRRAENLLSSSGQTALEVFVNEPERVLYSLTFGKLGFLVVGVGLALQVTAILGVANWLALSLMTFTVLVVVEIGPRSLAVGRATKVAGPVLTLSKPWLALVMPIAWMSARLSHLLTPSRGQVDLPPGSVSEEDVALMVDAGSKQGSLTDLKERILQSVFDFSDTIAREVMIPRTDMVFCSVDTKLEDLIDIVVTQGHSRIPVFEGTVDEIIGVFYAKDLIPQMRDSELEFDLRSLLREAFFVPDSKHINDLFKDFQTSRVHIAIVVDEFGGTAGLVTLEDIIEEFFGEIQDEYDTEERTFVPCEDYVLTDARLDLDEVGDYFGIDFPESDDFDTLGGYVMTRLGKVPKVGAAMTEFGLNFVVKEATQKRIKSVAIYRVDESAAPTDEPSDEPSNDELH